MERRIIVAGSRNFVDYGKLEASLNEIINGIRETVTIISGGARGADSLGERYAIDHDLSLVRFPADWKTKGRAAGVIRNREMAEYAVRDGATGILVAFWDGESRGTKNMINKAVSKGMEVRIISI